MNAAIVPPCSSGSTVSCGLNAIASTTAIVSPTARDMARMIEAMIPDSAAGKTTRRTTSNLVAPIANAPSRSPRGTARSASSDSDAISGVISSPTTSPADSMLNVPIDGKSGLRSSGVMKFRAKKPRTIVGMPAIVSRIGLTTFRVRERRVLGEVDRRQQAERDGDDERDQRDLEGARRRAG